MEIIGASLACTWMNGWPPAVIVVGRDTRESGEWLKRRLLQRVGKELAAKSSRDSTPPSLFDAYLGAPQAFVISAR